MDGYVAASLILVAFSFGSFAGYGVRSIKAYNRGYKTGFEFGRRIENARRFTSGPGN